VPGVPNSVSLPKPPYTTDGTGPSSLASGGIRTTVSHESSWSRAGASSST
jgi:hypothetical protein